MPFGDGGAAVQRDAQQIAAWRATLTPQQNKLIDWYGNGGPNSGYDINGNEINQDGLLGQLAPIIAIGASGGALAPALAPLLGGTLGGAAGAGALMGAGNAYGGGADTSGILKGALAGGGSGLIAGGVGQWANNTGALDALGSTGENIAKGAISGGLNGAVNGAVNGTGVGSGVVNGIESGLTGGATNAATGAIGDQLGSMFGATPSAGTDFSGPLSSVNNNSTPTTAGTNMDPTLTDPSSYDFSQTIALPTYDPSSLINTNTDIPSMDGLNTSAANANYGSNDTGGTGFMSTLPTNMPAGYDWSNGANTGTNALTSSNFTNPLSSSWSNGTFTGTPASSAPASGGGSPSAGGTLSSVLKALTSTGKPTTTVGANGATTTTNPMSALQTLLGLTGIVGGIASGNQNASGPSYQNVPGSALSSYSGGSGSGNGTSNPYNWQNYGYQPRVQNPANADMTAQDWAHYGEVPANQRPNGGSFFTPAAGAPVNAAFGPSQQQPTTQAGHPDSPLAQLATQAPDAVQQQQQQAQMQQQIQQLQAQLASYQQPQQAQAATAPSASASQPAQAQAQSVQPAAPPMSFAGAPPSPLAQASAAPAQAPAAQAPAMATATQGFMNNPRLLSLLQGGLGRFADGGSTHDYGDGNYYDDVIQNSHGLLGHHVDGAHLVNTPGHWIGQGGPQQNTYASNIQQPVTAADGGPLHAAGEHIKGPGDGTSDDIPAVLSDGEYVISADVVSALGNGSNDAGAKKLDEMMSNARKHASKNHAKGKLGAPAKDPEQYLGKDE